jgi:3-dehydroquinate synthase
MIPSGANIDNQSISKNNNYVVYSCFLYTMEKMKKLSSVGHDVVFGSAELILANYFKEFPDKRPIIIADENTFEFCWPKVLGSSDKLNEAEIIQLESGEEHKNLEVCTQVWMALSEMKLSRNDVIINLGGGVITDLGGFVANTFKRGVSFIQVPTSLLAMVDASVGGKVGVDLAGLKNLVGNFATPELVIIDVDFLDSLPLKQLKCGYAEVLKHGLISDKSYWAEAIADEEITLDKVKKLVYRSVDIKNSIVVNDFTEQGDRKKLNFGHTIGHALETHFLGSEQPLLHGEAVAIGMIVESWLSAESGFIGQDEFKALRDQLLKWYTVPQVSSDVYPELLEIMRNDKKNIGGKINFTFLDAIGTARINQTATEEKILEALDSLSA